MAGELKFYVIVSDSPDIDKQHRMIKSYCKHWSHYIYNMWMVATSTPREELIDLLREKGRSLLVVETDCDAVYGLLPVAAWKHLSNVRNEVELSKLDDPTLTEMMALGYFDSMLLDVHTVKDIDDILSPLEYKAKSRFELENVRGRMIDYLQQKLSIETN